MKIVPGYLIGGEKKKSEKNRLRRGVNILVATPGRLMDHIKTTECLKLSNVCHFVLDEADRMLDMGYERAIADISEAIQEARLYGDQKRFQSKYESTSDAPKSIYPPSDDENDEENDDDTVEPANKKLKSSNEETKAESTEVKKVEKSVLQTIMLSATLTDHVQRLAG